MRVFAGATLLAVACQALTCLPSAAQAASLPAIKTTSDNAVPECVTPGRLMSFLKGRNGKLNSRYDSIATEYMKHGEQLGLRWDYAFFQMIVETGSLTYTGDVKPDQNNFAGLGATGRGARGESFKDLSSGVRAHLEHVLMYTGEKIENPVAERTRNVQEWGVLTKWQQTIKGPMTYAHLTKQWAPSSRGYPRDINSVADDFFASVCNGPDPKPELVAEAREGRDGTATAPSSGETSVTATGTPAPAGKGAEIARQAVAEARAANDIPRTALGGGDLAKAAASGSLVNKEAPGPSFKILNQAPPQDPAPGSGLPPLSDAAKIESAALASPATATITTGPDKSKADAKPAQSCKVWTASYGGAKAIIIRANAPGATNYTVLDVNEGSEKKEAEAYITAYAKGGETIGEFTSSNQALNKAFELCPEG